MNLNASCGNHSMGLFRAFKSLLRRPSQRPLYVVGRLGRGEKARGGRWNSISSHRPPRACCFFFIITGLPVRPSHKFGFRSSVSKSGLPGEGRHEGLVPRNDVLTNGFIRFSRGALHGYFLYLVFIFRCVRLGSLDFGFAIEREIRKRISTLRSLFLDFFFTENSLANPFSDFPIDR